MFFTRRPPNPSDVRSVSLTEGIGTEPDGDTSITRIDNPDLLSPVPHSLPRLNPHESDYHALVTHKIEAMAARGSLDEFTIAVLDGWIDRERETWQAQALEAGQQRRRTAATILGQQLQNTQSARVTLAQLRSKRKRLAAEYEAACVSAGLPHPAADTTAADAGAQGIHGEPVFMSGSTVLGDELLAPAPRQPNPPADATDSASATGPLTARAAAEIDNITDFPAHPHTRETMHTEQHPSTAIQTGDLR